VKGFLVNDANPRWHYAEGGPDDERDPQEQYYGQQPYGYDEYGRPQPPRQQVQQAPPPIPQQQPGYEDPYQTYGGRPAAPPSAGPAPGWVPQQPQQPYYEQQPPPQAYDTGQHTVYGTGQMPAYETGQQPVYDTGQQPLYDTGQQALYQTGQQQPGYDTGQQALYQTGQQPVYDTGQQAAYDTGQHAVYDTGQQQVYDAGRPHAQAEEPAAGGQPPGRGEPEGRGDYKTEMFAFVDEESEHSEEVIDWLKFSESRTERREEAKRRGRNRRMSLVVVLVLALIGGAGYLWQAGKLPGAGKSSASQGAGAGGPQKRDVIVVHMIPVDGGPSATALLVDNATKGRGSTLLLPNTLALTTDDGNASTLGTSVGEGIGPTRDALNTLLGADIKGSWRLDSPFLELLVDALGDVIVDTDATIQGTGKDKGKTLVQKGEKQELSGQAAVAYAEYHAPGETQDKQLARFGQVFQGVLKKLPSDPADTTKVVQSLGQILDPSLTDKQLGASLAQLAELAKTGSYDTQELPVQPDGTLSAQATDSVKDLLGGTVKQAEGTKQPRVRISDATGGKNAAAMAQAAIANGGTYTYVSGGKAESTASTSQVLYADQAKLAAAKDVAATLGLPPTSVKKGKVPSNADIAVTLGKDYKPAQ
jgi:hypothetical protein